MINATLQQLRLFESVARNASFTRAAQEIHRSQPAVSIQVKRLEEQLGVSLFEQSGKRIFMTNAGKELYAACEDIFQRLHQFEEVMDELRGEVAGPLHIGVVTTAKYFLPHFLGIYMRKYPKVAPRLKVTNRENLVTRMEENLDDIYVMANTPENLLLVEYPFMGDDLVLAASPDHPLAGKKNIPPEALVKERLLFREPESAIRVTLEPFFQENGLEITPYMELGSGEAVKQACMAGLGVGMLSSYSISLEVESGRLVVLDVKGLPIHRQWRLAHLKGKKLSQAAQKFLELLLSEEIPPYGVA